MKKSAAAVQEALARYGVTCRVIELPASTRSAREAAQAIGCAIAQIAKSIVLRKTGTEQVVLAIVSGAKRVDEKKMADLIGCAVQQADPDLVRRVTGFAIGGVPPLGHTRRIETYIDTGLFDFAEIWAAAGTPNAVFQLTPAELERISAGRAAAIST